MFYFISKFVYIARSNNISIDTKDFDEEELGFLMLALATSNQNHPNLSPGDKTLNSKNIPI